MWERQNVEDASAAAPGPVAIGSVGWEIFSLEKEDDKYSPMSDMVDSESDEDDVESDSDEDDAEVWKEFAKIKGKLKEIVVEKKVCEKVDKEKSVAKVNIIDKKVRFKENIIEPKENDNMNKYIKNNNTNKYNKKFVSKNQFENLVEREIIYGPTKTEMNFGNIDDHEKGNDAERESQKNESSKG